jgi:hypothetical protein
LRDEKTQTLVGKSLGWQNLGVRPKFHSLRIIAILETSKKFWNLCFLLGSFLVKVCYTKVVKVLNVNVWPCTHVSVLSTNPLAQGSCGAMSLYPAWAPPCTPAGSMQSRHMGCTRASWVAPENGDSFSLGSLQLSASLLAIACLMFKKDICQGSRSPNVWSPSRF